MSSVIKSLPLDLVPLLIRVFGQTEAEERVFPWHRNRRAVVHMGPEQPSTAKSVALDWGI